MSLSHGEKTMGKYLNMVRQSEKSQEQTSQNKEPVQVQSGPVESFSTCFQAAESPGRDLTRLPMVWSISSIPIMMGRWAFCSVANNWVAVSAKFVTTVEEAGLMPTGRLPRESSPSRPGKRLMSPRPSSCGCRLIPGGDWRCVQVFPQAVDQAEEV
jgi:hypothetical protein